VYPRRRSNRISNLETHAYLYFLTAISILPARQNQNQMFSPHVVFLRVEHAQENYKKTSINSILGVAHLIHYCWRVSALSANLNGWFAPHVVNFRVLFPPGFSLNHLEKAASKACLSMGFTARSVSPAFRRPAFGAIASRCFAGAFLRYRRTFMGGLPRLP